MFFYVFEKQFFTEEIMDQHEQIWNDVCQRIKQSKQILDVQYNTWIDPIEKARFGDNVLFLWVPNTVARSSIEERYLGLIKDSVFKVTKKNYDIVLLLHDEEQPLENKIRKQPKETIIKEDESHLNPKYTFDTFVVGNSNRFAHAYSLSVAESPGGKYNPLFLYGGAGLGKTHLSQAIGHFMKAANPNAKVLYVSSEKYTNEFINSLRDKRTESFREKYRNADILIIDDIQFIAGKESTVEEFFHTFNDLYENGKQIVLTSDRPPNEINPIEERLRSRFAWGLTCDITPPDFETRIAILKNKAQNENIDFPDEVYQYIAENIKSNIRELEGALNKVIAYDRLNIQPINETITAEILKELVASRVKRAVTYDMVKKEICHYFHITLEDLMSTRKTKELAFARQMSMYLSFQMVKGSSSTAIGREYDRDHATVLYAINKIEADAKKNDKVRSMIKDITNNLTLD